MRMWNFTLHYAPNTRCIAGDDDLFIHRCVNEKILQYLKCYVCVNNKQICARTKKKRSLLLCWSEILMIKFYSLFCAYTFHQWGCSYGNWGNEINLCSKMIKLYCVVRCVKSQKEWHLEELSWTYTIHPSLIVHNNIL